MHLMLSFLLLEAVAQAPAFVGRWRPASFPVEAPALCREASLEFRGDGTVLSRSGNQVLTAKYATQERGSGFVLLLRDLTINDQPNCQGFSPQYVLDNHVSQLYVEVVGDTAKIGGGPSAPSMVMYRAP